MMQKTEGIFYICFNCTKNIHHTVFSVNRATTREFPCRAKYDFAMQKIKVFGTNF